MDFFQREEGWIYGESTDSEIKIIRRSSELIHHKKMDIKDPFLGWPIKLLKKNPYLMYKNKKDRDKLIKAARKNVYHSDIVEVKTPNGDIIAAEVQLFCPSKDDNIKGIIRPLAIKDDEEK